MEKGTSQFLRSAGRCGAMRRGVHAGMPLGTLPCLMPATLGQITSFSKKPSFFGKPAKAKACSSQGLGSPPWACSSQGQGMQQPRPRHAAAKAKACSSQGLGSPPGARRVPEGQWQHGEGVACPVGGMPRPWHALGTPRRPWQHLGGLLLPSLDSLFGHLPTLPPLKSA